MFFHKTPTILQRLYPGLVWHKRSQHKEIFLTFDDGPIPGLTPFVLATLAEFNVRATFFCVGDNLRKHSEIAKEAVSQGHRLGNHTFNHLDGWKTQNNVYVENIEKCDQYLPEVGTARPLFRPPYGKINRSQIKIVRQAYDIIMWDVLSWDFSRKISPESCLKNSIKATAKGSIVLFHDNWKAEKNLEYALPRYIEHFVSKGFVFKTL